MRAFLWCLSPWHLLERCLLHERQASRLHRVNPASSQVQHLSVLHAFLLPTPRQDDSSFILFSQKVLADPSEQDSDTADNSSGEVSSQMKCSAQFLHPVPPDFNHSYSASEQDMLSLVVRYIFGHSSHLWSAHFPHLVACTTKILYFYPNRHMCSPVVLETHFPETYVCPVKRLHCATVCDIPPL